MKKHTMKQRCLPLDDSWDVVVVGGGAAGCTAAAAAAREGARTLLIEATGALGGMGTSGLVPAWCPFTDHVRIIYGGLAEKVLKETMAGMPHVPPDRLSWTPIDPERLKRVYDQLVTGAGASIRFGTMLVEVACSQPRAPEAIIVAGKAGLEAVKARVYVDCTGDGDLATWSGADFEKGDESGELQPATHCFILSNVNTAAYQSGGQLTREKMVPILESGKYPQIPDRHCCNAIIGPGTIGFNAGHLWNVDTTRPETLAKAFMEGRKIAKAFRDALAEFYPQTYGEAFLVTTGSLMGVRETRRIIGDYYLTIDDFINVRSFGDEICRNCYYIDVHHKQSEIGTISDGDGDAAYLKKGQSHGIPYRCLTPKGLGNVLVAGRCISTDRPVQGSIRIMPVCLCTGEAAGLAAAMAAARDGDVHAVDTDELRKRLKAYGAYLPD